MVNLMMFGSLWVTFMHGFLARLPQRVAVTVKVAVGHRPTRRRLRQFAAGYCRIGSAKKPRITIRLPAPRCLPVRHSGNRCHELSGESYDVDADLGTPIITRSVRWLSI
jgi:hypothetical protein